MRIDRKTRKVLFKIKKLQQEQDILYSKLLNEYSDELNREYNILTTKILYEKRKLASSIENEVLKNDQEES